MLYDKELDFIFIPPKNIKYIKFGFEKIKAGNYYTKELILTENDINVIYQETDFNSIKKILELKKESSYSFRIKLRSDNLDYEQFNSFWFYIIPTDYPNIIPINVNSDAFQELPILSNIYLVIDLSIIKDRHKMLVEYSKEWYNQEIYIEGYETDDLSTINRESGNQLTLI